MNMGRKRLANLNFDQKCGLFWGQSDLHLELGAYDPNIATFDAHGLVPKFWCVSSRQNIDYGLLHKLICQK